MTRITRRRVITITAAAAGFALLGPGRRSEAAPDVVTWNGHVMGATATMQLHHPDRMEAERLIEASVSEVRRIESIFSLYRDDSELVRLNRDGVLVAPAPDIVEVLAASRLYHDLTNGAFDPTVQPLWALYRAHFSALDATPEGPAAGRIAATLKDVGMEKVLSGRDRIVLRRGMALTLNGIAQGYATDRVVGILRAGGITSSLVDLGEIRAIGSGPGGRPWRAGLADPDKPDTISEALDLIDSAVATSAGRGFSFDRAGLFGHLLDPRRGRPADRYRSVTVIAPTAMEADALSTAFSLMPVDDVEQALKQLGRGHAVISAQDGKRFSISG